jgi:hypothetical protein
MSQANETYAYGKLLTDPVAIALINRIRAHHTVYLGDVSNPDTTKEYCDHHFECECAAFRYKFVNGKYDEITKELDLEDKLKAKRELKARGRLEAKYARRRVKRIEVDREAKEASLLIKHSVDSFLDAFEKGDHEKFGEDYDKIWSHLNRMKKQMIYRRFQPY